MTDETGTTGAAGRKGILDQLEQLALVLAGASLIGVVAVQAWQVFARYVLNNSPSWTEPLALVFICNAAMLGAAVGARRETHFSFPLLADKAPPAIRMTCRAVSRLAMVVLGAGLSIYGAMLTANNWDVAMAGAGLPVGMRFAPVAWGGALLALFAAERLLSGFKEPAQQVVETA